MLRGRLRSPYPTDQIAYAIPRHTERQSLAENQR